MEKGNSDDAKVLAGPAACMRYSGPNPPSPEINKNINKNKYGGFCCFLNFKYFLDFEFEFKFKKKERGSVRIKRSTCLPADMRVYNQLLENIRVSSSGHEDIELHRLDFFIVSCITFRYRD